MVFNLASVVVMVNNNVITALPFYLFFELNYFF